jgi:hypothetical protein
MVGANDGEHWPGEIDGLQDSRANLWMLFNLFEFLFAESARLKQDVIGDSELPNIMQERPRIDRFDKIFRQAHLFGQGNRITLHPNKVMLVVLVLGVNSQGKTSNRA